MWSRQLLRRIEEPMRKFATNRRSCARRRASAVKTYNVVAKALVAFEALWLQAWKIHRVEQEEAGLQATLMCGTPRRGTCS